MGQPRCPFEQLMCVFPKQSCHALPECYHWLMRDSHSPIIDFYPVKFKLDINGAAYAWMGVNLLPFIDQDRLIKAMRAADNDQERLTPAQRIRNKRSGDVFIFYGKGESSALRRAQLEEGTSYAAEFESKDEVTGKVIGTQQENTGNFRMMRYEPPTYDRHSTQLMEGVSMPKREVEEFEIYQVDRKVF